MIFFVHPHMPITEGSGQSWAYGFWWSHSWYRSWQWSSHITWPYPPHGR